MPNLNHADFCIECVIEGRAYRFRGFLVPEDGCQISKAVLLERIKAAGDEMTKLEDNEHLWLHRDQWPRELKGYCLVTNEPDPRPTSDFVRCFQHGRRAWTRYWGVIGYGFDRSCLAVCRSA